MIVNRNSWHFWIFKHLSHECCDYHNPAVCKYVGVVALSPIFALGAVIIAPVVLIIYFGNKAIEAILSRGRWPKLKLPTCPFGKVEFIVSDPPASPAPKA